ncbi:MAG: translation initiation factor IF-2 associated domain-containing protein, partial [Acidiferrobacterales bacterium]
MASTTIKGFAEQIGVEPSILLKQLASAGIEGKKANDSLTDDEKLTLLTFLRKGQEEPGAKKKITLKRKTTSQVKQSTRGGPARTVQVEVRKKRTYVKRTDIEAERQAEEEAARKAEEEKQAAEEAARKAEEEK